jgi:hypothetical protein
VFRSLCAATVLLVALAAGCGSDAPAPVVSPAAGAEPAPTGSGGQPMGDDPPGTNTCQLLVTAINDAALMEPGVVDAIARAGGTADAPVADAAHRLAAAYAAAVAAKGADSEPDAVAAVSAAGSEMATVCDESGLAHVG